MKLQRYFGKRIINNILKSQKLPIILLGFIFIAIFLRVYPVV